MASLIAVALVLRKLGVAMELVGGNGIFLHFCPEPGFSARFDSANRIVEDIRRGKHEDCYIQL